MPSTYSTSLRLELMADGEKSGTWGTITNTNLGTLIEQGVAGVASVAHDDSASYTLTTNNGSSDEARNAVVLMTGALTADREVIVPDVDKVYIFKNGTSGGFALTFKTSAGTGVTIPNGRASICYVDSGTGTVNAIDDGYFTDSIYIEGSSDGDFITAESTNAGSGSGPDIKLYRNSASPADGDTLSKIIFSANTDDGAGGVSVEDVEYASIKAVATETNETTGEAAKLVIQLKRGGVTQNYIEIEGGTSSDSDNDSVVFKTGGTQAFRIDSSQKTIISSLTSAISTAGSTPRLQVLGSSFPDSSVVFGRGAANANASGLNFVKSRNNNFGGNTILQNDDQAMYIAAYGDDGTDYNTPMATIVAEVDGTPGANDMPGRIRFSTTADGASTVTEAMRIDSQGRVQINATVAGSSSNVGQLRVNLPANGHSTIDNLVYIQGASGTGLLFGNHLDGDGYGGDIIVRGYSSTHGDLRFTRYTGNYTDPIQSMTIDSSGRVMIGATTNIPVVNASLQFEVIGDSTVSGAGGIAAARFGGGSTLALGGSPRSTTTGSYVIVQDDDNLGNIFFSGDDGTDLRSVAARISADVDGTPGLNDMPGRLAFYTTADGGTAATERMRISSGGQVNIGENINVFTNPNLQIRTSDSTAISGADIWSALNKPTIDIRNPSNTQFSYTGINMFGGSSSNSFAGMYMVQTAANSAGALTFWTGGIGSGSPYAYEAMRIDSSQRLLIGNTSSISGYSVQTARTNGTVGFSALRYSNDAYGAYMVMSKSRSGTIGGNTAVQSGDALGYLNWAGNDGTDMNSLAAGIWVEVDGTPGSNDMPGRLVFKTTADGSSGSTERLRITNDGKMLTSSTGGGTPGAQLQVSYSDSSTTHSAQGQVPNGLRMYNADTSTNALTSISFAAPNAGTALASINMVNQNAQSASTLCLGDLTFSTKQNGQSTQYERMRVKSDGAIQIKFGSSATTIASFGNSSTVNGVAGSGSQTYTPFTVARDSGTGRSAWFAGNLKFDDGYGLDFSATSNGGTVGSELLTDYEHGTWTPVIEGSTTNPSVTYQQQNGEYVRVGNMLWIAFYLYVANGNLSGGSGNINVAGLPFSVQGAGNGAYNFIPAGYVHTGGATNNAQANNTMRWQVNAHPTTEMQLYSTSSSTWGTNFWELSGTGVLQVYA